MVEVWTGGGHSSAAEHSTADREVPGSNPDAPFALLAEQFSTETLHLAVSHILLSNVTGQHHMFECIVRARIMGA